MLNTLKGRSIFIDTAPFIYFMEGGSAYEDVLKNLFSKIDTGQINATTSTMTLMEVLVHPVRLGKIELADQYTHIFTASPHLELYELDIAIAKRAAALRASLNLKTPDAIQLATAIEKGCDYFLTNDFQLKKPELQNLEVLFLSELG